MNEWIEAREHGLARQIRKGDTEKVKKFEKEISSVKESYEKMIANDSAKHWIDYRYELSEKTKSTLERMTKGGEWIEKYL